MGKKDRGMLVEGAQDADEEIHFKILLLLGIAGKVMLEILTY